MFLGHDKMSGSVRASESWVRPLDSSEEARRSE